MVLVGTTLELACFLFEIPTGIVADLYSRRLSIVIGFVLIGAGFLLQGLVPAFFAILAAQVLWGIGFTFTSGADQAWITDEIGVERVDRVFVHAQQFELGGTAGAELPPHPARRARDVPAVERDVQERPRRGTPAAGRPYAGDHQPDRGPVER
ncbi:MAG TPA: MFS transporter, partial [Kribbella sp.]|nr:MFS transporter [Kribbella sp.]